MNWVKVRVDFFARLGAALLRRPECNPFALHLAATIWCSEHGRSGCIPASELNGLQAWNTKEADPLCSAQLLVEAGLWENDGVRFRLLDFNFQEVPTELSEKRSDAGKRGNEKRWGADRKHRKPSQTSRVEESRREEKRSEEKEGSGEISKTISGDGSAAPAKRERKKPTGPNAEALELYQGLSASIAEDARPADTDVPDYVALAKMIEAHGVDVVKDRIRRCFAERFPAFFWSEGTPTLRVICSPNCFNKLARLKPFQREIPEGADTGGEYDPEEQSRLADLRMAQDRAKKNGTA